MSRSPCSSLSPKRKKERKKEVLHKYLSKGRPTESWMTRTDGAVGAMDGAVFLFFVFLGFSHCVEPLVYAYTHNRSIISFLSFFLTSLFFFFFFFFLNRLWSLSWLRAASAVRFSTRSLAPSGVKWRPTVRRIPFRWKRRWKNWTSCMSTVRSAIRIWSDCWPKVLEFSKKSATPKADWPATMSMPGACVCEFLNIICYLSVTIIQHLGQAINNKKKT